MNERELEIQDSQAVDMSRPGDPFQGAAADMIAASIRNRMTGTQPPPTPEPPPEAPEQIVQAPRVQLPSDRQGDVQPTVSTSPVTDFSSVFRAPEAPAPTQDTNPVQLPPDSPVQDPEDLQTEKAKNAWQELKAREKQSRLAAVELQARLDKAIQQGQAVADERVKFADELKNRDDRIKELEVQLGQLSLEHQPEFKEKYDAPMASIAEQVEGIVSDATDLTEPEKVSAAADRILEANDADFNRMVSKLPAPVQGLLLEKRREFSRLNDAREHALSDWQATQSGVEQTASQQSIVERAQRRRDMAEAAIRFTKVDTPPENRFSILTESTYADDVKNADAGFRGFMQEATDDQIANAAYKGFLTPVLQRQIAYLAEACEQWRNAYESVRGVRHPPVRAMRVQTDAPQPQVQTPVQLEPSDTLRESIVKSVEGAFARAGSR